MSNTNINRTLNGINSPLAYMGTNPNTPPQVISYQRAPTVNDSKNFQIGTLWIIQNTISPVQAAAVYVLTALIDNQATWTLLAGGAGNVEEFFLDVGTAVPAAGIINLTGGTSGAIFTGSGNTITESFNFLKMADSTDTTGYVEIGGSVILWTGPTGSVSGNIALGGGALLLIGTGTNNTGIGVRAGFAYTSTESDNIVIGNVGVLGESNVLRIGTTGSSTGQQDNCYIAGINGVDVGSVDSVVVNSGDHLGTAILTAGAGVTITPGANIITIAATGGGVSWTVITANQSAVPNNGYICNKAGLLTLTLPTVAAVGTIIRVVEINSAMGWRIAQNALQSVVFGISTTTVGTGGSISSTEIGDAIELVCTVANTTWYAISAVGYLTIV